MNQLIAALRSSGAEREPAAVVDTSSADTATSIFLYAVRSAIMAGGAATTRSMVHNGRQHEFKATKQTDAAAGAVFARRGIARADRVMRLTGDLTPDAERRTLAVRHAGRPVALWPIRKQEAVHRRKRAGRST